MAGAALWVIPILIVLPPTIQGMYYNTYAYNSAYNILPYSASCTSGTCGVNAHCTTSGGRPVCACLPGHEGDPLGVCRKLECTDHTDCRGHLACQNNRCINPCDGACGTNSNCDARNHVPVCTCPPHYTGNPFTGCRLMDPNEACHPSPCGSNSKCDVVNSVPTCTCLPGYFGNPLSGCRHECDSDSDCNHQQQCRDFKCVSPCDKCGLNAQCETVRSHQAVCKCLTGYFGDPYRACQAECNTNSDCPSFKPVCSALKCIDPCVGACGISADCNLRGSTPVCSCPRNMTGNPFVSCRPFEKRDLCDPNPCGVNAQCTPGYDNLNQERPVCTCLPGHIGNALRSCQRGECQADVECPDNKACIDLSCQNPCRGQCGAGAECSARRHIAVCTCPDGTQGDALLVCNTKRNYATSARYFRYYNKK